MTCPCTTHFAIPVLQDDGRTRRAIVHYDQVIDSLFRSGMTDIRRVSRDVEPTSITKEDTPHMPDPILDKLDVIEQKIDKLLQQKPATGGSGGGGGRRGGSKMPTANDLSDVQEMTARITAVYTDVYNGKTRYAIQIDGGPKVATWDRDAGETAVDCKNRGVKPRMEYGKNSKGFFDLISITPF